MRAGVFILALIGMFAWGSHSQAYVSQERRDSVLKNIERVAITIDDNVTDGCWTNGKAIKSIVEAALLRENINIIEEGDWDALMSISATGFSLLDKAKGKYCATYFQIQLQVRGRTVFYSGPKEDIFTGTTSWREGRLLYSSGPNNDQVRQFASDWMSELVVDILKARHTP